MKVLVVVHGFPPSAQGGAEIYAHAHALRCAEAGDEVARPHAGAGSGAA